MELTRIEGRQAPNWSRSSQPLAGIVPSMATLSDFIARQRAAGARLEAAWTRLTADRATFAKEMSRIVPEVLSVPDRRTRTEILEERAAVPFAEAAAASGRDTQEIFEATAELSANWAEHESVWDALTANELPQVEETAASVSLLWDSAVRAKGTNREFRRSLTDLGSLSPSTSQLARSLLHAVDLELEAAGEVQALCDEEIRTIDDIVERLRGTDSKPGPQQ